MWCIAVQQVSNQLTYEYVSDVFGVVETAQLNDMAFGRPSQRALPIGKLTGPKPGHPDLRDRWQRVSGFRGCLSPPLQNC